MPKPLEELWNVLKDNQYDKARQIIQKNPNEDLVNSTDPLGNFSLVARICMLSPYPLELIKSVAADERLNLQYQNPKTKKRNIECILFTGTPEVFDAFAHNISIIHNGDQLSYERAQKSLKTVSTAYETAFKQNAKSDSTATYAKKIKGLNYIMTKLREMTIRHAIETDDTTILENLEKAGCNLSEVLHDGRRPGQLLGKNNVKAGPWFQQRADRMMDRVNLSDSTHAMEMFQSYSKRLTALTLDYERKQGELRSKTADERMASLDSAMSSLKK